MCETPNSYPSVYLVMVDIYVLTIPRNTYNTYILFL